MTIIDKLNSGALHAAARAKRPECADRKGNVHGSEERARFVNWLYQMQAIYGQDVEEWPELARAEYRARYVPSH